MSDLIRIKRGLKANLPALMQGELGFCTDTKEVFIGAENGNKRISGNDIVNVHDFGAKGDGTTDDTNAIQAAINSVGTYTYTHPDPYNILTNGGGIVFFPKGTYIIKGSLKYSSQIHLMGEGWNTVIKHTPLTALNLFEPDTAKYGSFGSMHGFTVEKLSLVGDRLNNAGTGNSGIGVKILNTRFGHVRDCMVTGFQTGVWLGGDNQSSYRYFHSIEYIYAYNNVLNVHISQGANGTQIIGGEISHNGNYTASDYCVKIEAAAVAIIGTTIEGRPNIAQVFDSGQGTAYNGVYSETTQGDTIGYKPMLDLDAYSNYGGVSIQAPYHATVNSPLIKFRNLVTSDLTAAYDRYYGVTVNGGGQYIDGILNGDFEFGIRDWTFWPTTTGTAQQITDTTQLLCSDYGLLLTRNATSDPNGCRVYQSFTMNAKNVLLLAVVKLSPNAVFEMFAYGFGETGNQYALPLVDYGGGYYLYGLWLLNNNSASRTGTLTLRLSDTSPNGTTAVISNVQPWAGGFPVFPPKTPKKEMTGTAVPSIGTYKVGDRIYISNPAAAGKIGWVCVGAGSPGTWKPFGAIDA